MVFVLLQITVVTFLPFNLQIADIKQLANTYADSNEEFDHYLHVNHVLYSLRLISNSNKVLI